MTWSFAYGLFMLWLVVVVCSLVFVFLEGIARALGLGHKSGSLGLLVLILVGMAIMTAWSAFAGLTVRTYTPDVSTFSAVLLIVLGFLSLLIASFIMGEVFLSGDVFAVLNLIAVLVSYILFVSWPAAAEATHGVFLGLLGVQP